MEGFSLQSHFIHTGRGQVWAELPGDAGVETLAAGWRVPEETCGQKRDHQGGAAVLQAHTDQSVQHGFSRDNPPEPWHDLRNEGGCPSIRTANADLIAL